MIEHGLEVPRAATAYAREKHVVRPLKQISLDSVTREHAVKPILDSPSFKVDCLHEGRYYWTRQVRRKRKQHTSPSDLVALDTSFLGFRPGFGLGAITHSLEAGLT